MASSTWTNWRSGKCTARVLTAVRKPTSCSQACKQLKASDGRAYQTISTGENSKGGQFDLCAVFKDTSYRSGFQVTALSPNGGCIYGYGNEQQEESTYNCYCQSAECSQGGSSAPLQSRTVSAKALSDGNTLFDCPTACTKSIPEGADSGEAFEVDSNAYVCSANEGWQGMRPGTSTTGWNNGQCIVVSPEGAEVLTSTINWSCLCKFNFPTSAQEGNSTGNSSSPTTLGSIKPTIPSTSSADSTSKSSDAMSVGTIIGIVLGGVAAIALLIIAIMWVKKRGPFANRSPKSAHYGDASAPFMAKHPTFRDREISSETAFRLQSQGQEEPQDIPMVMAVPISFNSASLAQSQHYQFDEHPYVRTYEENVSSPADDRTAEGRHGSRPTHPVTIRTEDVAHNNTTSDQDALTTEERNLKRKAVGPQRSQGLELDL